ncbi:unnamed protein product, partial [Ectocarpus sp. 4 AP-2014]
LALSSVPDPSSSSSSSSFTAWPCTVPVGVKVPSRAAPTAALPFVGDPSADTAAAAAAAVTASPSSTGAAAVSCCGDGRQPSLPLTSPLPLSAEAAGAAAAGVAAGASRDAEVEDGTKPGWLASTSPPVEEGGSAAGGGEVTDVAPTGSSTLRSSGSSPAWNRSCAIARPACSARAACCHAVGWLKADAFPCVWRHRRR